MTDRAPGAVDIRIVPVTKANRALVTALRLAPEQV
ncbi:MAG: GNAT family N-acetyltransferase, partial [Mesorhizobium sp.]